MFYNTSTKELTYGGKEQISYNKVFVYDDFIGEYSIGVGSTVNSGLFEWKNWGNGTGTTVQTINIDSLKHPGVVHVKGDDDNRGILSFANLNAIHFSSINKFEAIFRPQDTAQNQQLRIGLSSSPTSFSSRCLLFNFQGGSGGPFYWRISANNVFTNTNIPISTDWLYISIESYTTGYSYSSPQYTFTMKNLKTNNILFQQVITAYGTSTDNYNMSPVMWSGSANDDDRGMYVDYVSLDYYASRT